MPTSCRRRWPYCRSWRNTVLAVALGMAKPRPSFPPDCDMMNVLTPTTSPRMLTSGPPELPGLIGASVCTKICGESGFTCRATAETSPWVKLLRSPLGLPNANTISPWRTCE